VDYKNKQLMEKIMFENSFRYHTKKEGYPSLSSDINKLDEIRLCFWINSLGEVLLWVNMK
jgi:hypothetical protein